MNTLIEIKLTQEEATDLMRQLDRYLYSELGLKIKGRIERALNDKDQWSCPTCGGTAWRDQYGD